MIFIIAFLSLATCYENCTLTYKPEATKAFPILEPYSFNDSFTVIEIDNSTDALCLDGTNYKFWFHKGTGTGANKFMFNWIGSAFCGADGTDILSSCYQRSLTEYGSSDSYGDNGTLVFSGVSWGYFSSIQEFNPEFYNWNKVALQSCDGGNHQGFLREPVLYNNTNLWFRGFNNTMATIEYLRNHYDIFNASEIILGGGSSGGTAAYVWSNYLQDYFPSTIKVMGMPDAGFFMDTYDPSSKCHLFRYFMQQLSILLENQKSILYRNCLFFGTSEVWKCMIPQYILRDIGIPMFMINSQVDYEQLTNLGGVECIMENGGPESCTSDDKKEIIKVREYFLKRIMEIKIEKPTWGFWMRTCFEHTYAFTWAWYGTSMNVYSAESKKSASLREALHEWYNGGEIKEYGNSAYIDLIDWEHNTLCHF